MNYVICKRDVRGYAYGYVAEINGIDSTRYLTSKLSDSLLYDTLYLANHNMKKNVYLGKWHVRKVTDKELFKARLSNT